MKALQPEKEGRTPRIVRPQEREHLLRNRLKRLLKKKVPTGPQKDRIKELASS